MTPATPRRATAAAILAALLGAGCGDPQRPIEARGERPNVVVVMIDTARAGYLDVYGGPGGLTPYLAELAQESAVLERAFSTSSWTAPSTASLFTGQYPATHGVTEGFFVHRKRARASEEGRPASLSLDRIAEGSATLPEVFRGNGYATFGLASNPNICEPMGFARGFDRFHQENYERAGDMFARLRGWRDALDTERPAFVYLHLSDPHEPYGKWEEFYRAPADEADEPKARYWSELGYVDAQIRRIVEWLGAERNTLLVVVSDHGEEFGDHGGTGHKPQLYDELTRVVLMFRGPELGIRPQRVSVNVSLIDVLPTLVDLLALERDAPGTAAGRSLAPILRRAPAAADLADELADRTLFAHRLDHEGGSWWAAMRGHWKLIERPDGERELYDHGRDPGEQSDLFSAEPDEARPLAEALAVYRSLRPAAPTEQVEVELDEELEASLQALGYVE